MLIVPHFGVLTPKRRRTSLEALMAVNYRIAIGKFGLDLDDGEIRLEEAIPLANDGITFEQFQLALGAIMQVVAMYHSLLPRVRYANLTAQEALEVCEREFFEESRAESSEEETDDPDEEDGDEETPELPPELDVNDVLAEITRLFEEGREKE
jgi:TctA family transporter